MEFDTRVQHSCTHRPKISVYFIFVQRWVIGGYSTKLAHLITITLHIYTVKNVISTC